ncbi:MAG: hypothetical protein LBU58_08140, partial [Clostridiales bacterium]|nr:hypothetical protein [Clostridiales bacterium]
MNDLGGAMLGGGEARAARFGETSALRIGEIEAPRSGETEALRFAGMEAPRLVETEVPRFGEIESLRFVKFDPSGNTTVLILDPVPRERFAEVARVVMSDRSVGAEQVGFCLPGSPPGSLPRLQMMGGEFCGNAARCFAAWLAMEGGAELSGKAADKTGADKTEVSVSIEVSGSDAPLTARVGRIRGKPNGRSVSIAMPMPLPDGIVSGRDEALGDFNLVAFPGITHLILWEREPEGDRQVGAERVLARARALIARHGFSTECFGLLYCDCGGTRAPHAGSPVPSCADSPAAVQRDPSVPPNAGALRMVPLVRVEAADSLVWEGSCGSGTVAVACALAARSAVPATAQTAVTEVTLAQPGGCLGARVEWA